VAERVPVEGPNGEVVGVFDFVRWVYALGNGVLWVGVIVRRNRRGDAGRRILFVEEIVIDATINAASRQQVLVYGMPGHSHDVLFVSAQK
jgi:hypothetical protein